MSSLHIINRATNSFKGGGIPFYDKIDYVFSKLNDCANTTIGIWGVPNDKVPTFQLWLPYEFLTSITYKGTDGEGNFTGTDFTPAASGGLTIEPAQLNGTQYYIYETFDTTTLAPTAPDGRWIIELVVNDGVTEYTYYSEEFLTKPCC